VPLQLISKTDQKVIWKNPRPSSTCYCRPIRFQFNKETTEVSKSEEKNFKEKINFLIPTELCVQKSKIFVEHSLQLTMVDGKVCNTLSESHSTKCYICEVKTTEMNNLNECLDKKVSTKFFEFGLSPLHAKIRFFEYFLHLSYKSVIKMWQARGPQQKQKVLERKR